MLPNLFLRLPVNNISLFHRSSKVYLPEVFAFGEVRAGVDMAIAVARDAVRDYFWDGGPREGGESCLDGVGTIVNYEGLGGRSWARGLGSGVARRHC